LLSPAPSKKRIGGPLVFRPGPLPPKAFWLDKRTALPPSPKQPSLPSRACSPVLVLIPSSRSSFLPLPPELSFSRRFLFWIPLSAAHKQYLTHIPFGPTGDFPLIRRPPIGFFRFPPLLQLRLLCLTPPRLPRVFLGSAAF